MPPRRVYRKKEVPEKFVPEFPSDDDDEEEEEEEEEGSGDRHPDDTNSDEKAEDSKSKKRGIPGGSRPSSTTSAAKSTKLIKERVDKELAKSPVPYWKDPKFWIPVFGIIQMYVSFEDIIFFRISNSA